MCAGSSTLTKNQLKDTEIPINEYYEYFGPEYELDVKASKTDDLNTRSYLDLVKRKVMENLRHAGGPPSVQMSGNGETPAVLNLRLTSAQIYRRCPSTRK